MKLTKLLRKVQKGCYAAFGKNSKPKKTKRARAKSVSGSKSCQKPREILSDRVPTPIWPRPQRSVTTNSRSLVAPGTIRLPERYLLCSHLPDGVVLTVCRAAWTSRPPWEPISQTGLFDLPAELRNKIYQLVLIDPRDSLIELQRPDRWLKRYNKDEIVPWREPALLRTCRTLQREASAIFYKNHSFMVRLGFFSDIKYLTRWLSGIILRCGDEPFKHFNFYVEWCCWDSFEHVRPLVQLFYLRDIQLHGGPALDADSLERLSGRSPSRRRYRSIESDANFQVALKEAILLGRKAREEGWKEDQLDVEFGRLLLEKRYDQQVRNFECWLAKQRRERGTRGF